MNPYTKNINRIEFVITYACTGRCKHCSEGEHFAKGEYINGEKAAEMIRNACSKFKIESLMTFGGEPLLHVEEVCRIHATAAQMDIPKRQIITNGFFSKDTAEIKAVAKELAQSGVNEVLVSADTFHQETIPLEAVKTFTEAVKNESIPIKVHPAWLVSNEAENTYNIKTRNIVKEFESMGIPVSDGNVIFPKGNALKYLKEYFNSDGVYINPYKKNPKDIKTLSVKPDGSVLGGNIYRTDILDIIKNYKGE